MIKLTCDGNGQCDFHAEGGDERERCPGMCEVPGCTDEAQYELMETGLCEHHAELALAAVGVKAGEA